MRDDLTELGTAERNHLCDLAKAWEPYGPALREWSSLDGGMQWKTVNGAEYLTRYRQDPETGKKRFTSLGRRSPETERLHADFLKRRDAAKRTVLTGRDGITKAGRVARAYGLARMPAKTAEVLRGLSQRLFDQPVVVFGGTALFAYELDAGALAPARLVEDDHLILLTLGRDLDADGIGAAYTATAGEDAAMTRRGDRTIFRVPGFSPIEVWRAEYVLSRLEGDQLDVLRSALACKPVTGLTVARDGQPVEFQTLDVRSYAMAAQVLALDGDELWDERAACARAMAARMGLEFDAEQVAAFPDPDADGPFGSPRA